MANTDTPENFPEWTHALGLAELHKHRYCGARCLDCGEKHPEAVILEPGAPEFSG